MKVFDSFILCTMIEKAKNKNPEGQSCSKVNATVQQEENIFSHTHDHFLVSEARAALVRPKLPETPFMLYSQEVKDLIQEENPTMSPEQINGEALLRYGNLSREELSNYEDMASKASEIYDQEFEVYKIKLLEFNNLEKKLLTKLGNIEVVNIPESTTIILDYAFKYYSSLVSIQIPNGVTKIYTHAFAECSSLKSIDIPKSVVEIGDGAFFKCFSLKSVSMSSNLIKLGTGTFSKCMSLECINLPNTITEIPEGLFYNCTSLKYCDIPASVKVIGGDAFAQCTSLTSMHIPNNIKKILTRSFYGCKNLVSILIPKFVEEIGNAAFDNCSSLISIAVAPSNFQESFSCSAGIDLDTLCQMDEFYYGRHFCLSEVILNRFSKLPIHDICYYDLNDTTIHQFSDLVQRHQSTLINTDGAKMTALHVLCCNPTARPELINVLINACPKALFMQTVNEKSTYGEYRAPGMTPYMIFLLSRGLISFEMFFDNETFELPSLHRLVEMGVKWRDLEIILECFGSEVELKELLKDEARTMFDLVVNTACNPNCGVDAVYALALRMVDVLRTHV